MPLSFSPEHGRYEEDFGEALTPALQKLMRGAKHSWEEEPLPPYEDKPVSPPAVTRFIREFIRATADEGGYRSAGQLTPADLIQIGREQFAALLRDPAFPRTEDEATLKQFLDS